MLYLQLEFSPFFLKPLCFPDVLYYLSVNALIFVNSTEDIHKSTFAHNRYRSHILRQTDTINFTNSCQFCNHRKKGLYSLGRISISRVFLPNMIADFPVAIFNWAQLNVTNVILCFL